VESGAELDRFLGRDAGGVLSLGTDRIDLPRTLTGTRMAPPDSFVLPPARGLEPSVERGLSTWLQETLAARTGSPPSGYPEWMGALLRLRDFLASCPVGSPPTDWHRWTRSFSLTERDLHWRTSGWVDTTFYKEAESCVSEEGGPPQARAAVAFMHGVGSWDFLEAAAAADVLLEPVEEGQVWIPAADLLDGAVLAYLKVGRPADARRAFDLLAGRSGRPRGDARDALLDALIRKAGA
jgi:hypothetical protein